MAWVSSPGTSKSWVLKSSAARRAKATNTSIHSPSVVISSSGLIVDPTNQPELTDARLTAWMKQVKKEFGVK